MKRWSQIAALIAACFLFSTSGCEQPKNSDIQATTASKTDDHGHDHDGEGHPDHEGHESHDDDHGSHASPRGGHIIELGRDHQYHAELIDNHDDRSIMIYILDGKMKNLKINAETASLTLISGDGAQTFELVEVGKDDDQGSSFSVKDETAFELIKTDGVEGKLRVSIDGKPFTGTFKHHDHDH